MAERFEMRLSGFTTSWLVLGKNCAIEFVHEQKHFVDSYLGMCVRNHSRA